MRMIRKSFWAALAGTLAACAGQTDHFYALTTLPEAVRPSGTAVYTAHVILSISIPNVVDRRQMVINDAHGQVLVLEHERWAAPMSELVAQTLARDIEQRRPEVIVGDRGFDQADVPAIKMKVEIVQMTAHKGGRAALEAHWRLVDAGAKVDELGGETFSAPIEGEDYAAVARAFSAVLGALADRLVEKLPVH